MTLNDTFSIPSHVMARPVQDEAVILDLASGTYFGLDPVGAQLWAALARGLSVAQACDALMSEFDVERPQLESDVVALIQQLLDKQLIHVGLN
ncbi:PqqD family protein [Hydrogenophaga sp. MI9]|uniref:PqqD family protein n=1 Tax=Hydrogenophaga sp. MI9 TaxID=3453719 RepID=UPI003EE84736